MVYRMALSAQHFINVQNKDLESPVTKITWYAKLES